MKYGSIEKFFAMLNPPSRTVPPRIPLLTKLSPIM